MPVRPVAYLGPEGTFSHFLACKRFGASREMLPCPDLAGVFEVVRQRPEALGVVPIENSSGGTLYDTIDLLIHNADTIRVQEDLGLDVRLALLGHKDRPFEEIFSHFVPLHHHRNWLQTTYPGVKLTSVPSTSVAAATAAKSRKAAALAAPGAAALYRLDVLQFPIHPETVNVTRFYVIGQGEGRERKAALHKTTMVVRLKNRCGSLHSFLGPFSKAKVNLRMIVSRPVPGHPETYTFLVEVEGQSCREPLQDVLRRAGRHCEQLDLVGSFPSGRRFSS